MSHANAPLSLEGRRLLVEQCKTRRIAHVAARWDLTCLRIEVGQPVAA